MTSVLNMRLGPSSGHSRIGCGIATGAWRGKACRQGLLAIVLVLPAFAVRAAAPGQPPMTRPAPTAPELAAPEPAAPESAAPSGAPILPTAAATPDTLAKPTPKPAALDMAGFLDRLMIAESGGRSDARNPRSTAVGPYQFIESTWLLLARRIFAVETQAMTPVEVLDLRSDRAFARRAAEAYTNDNAAILVANGLEATFPRLRLAFLLGAQGAVRVLQAPPQTRVTALLGPAVSNANPFMYGLSAEGLIARAARDLDVPRTTTAGIAASESQTSDGSAKGKFAAPRVIVRCNIDRPACRRWQALALARQPITRLAMARSVRKPVAGTKSRL